MPEAQSGHTPIACSQTRIMLRTLTDPKYGSLKRMQVQLIHISANLSSHRRIYNNKPFNMILNAPHFAETKSILQNRCTEQHEVAELNHTQNKWSLKYNRTKMDGPHRDWKLNASVLNLSPEVE